MAKKAILVLLSVAIGIFFLFSAYSKLYPLTSFEYSMVEFMHLPWLISAIAARFFIGIEAGLGLLIALHFYGKSKWVIKAAILLLSVFSVYLIFLWATAGNKVNCGCMGDSYFMSPSASLIKNAVLLLVLYLLLRLHNGLRFKAANILSVILLLISISLPYFLFAIPQQKPDWLRNDRYALDLSNLYLPGKKDIPAVELRRGKHIIAYLSATCPHCRMAAYKMHLMKQQDTSLPFFMVIGGTRSLDEFWDKTKANNIPNARLDADQFIQITGGVFPTILWIDNDTVIAKSTYLSLNEQEIEQWMHK